MRPRPTTKATSAAVAARWPVKVFLISLAIPWILEVGPLRLSAYRLVLIATILPCFAMWASGKAGRLRVADFALLLYCFWCLLSIMVIHGPSAAVEPAGIIFLETMGAYLLARCYIRSADDFLAVVRLLFRMILLLAPFALFEAVTGRNVLLEFFATFAPTSPDIYMDPRWGMRRAHTIFEHPILFGVITGSAFALTHMVLGYGQPLLRRWFATAIVGLTASLSLSAGPITALTAQGMLLGWNFVLKPVEGRWKLLVGFAVLAFLAAELLTNRSLPVIFISYFAFDEESAWVRIAIWQYGSLSVMNHPLLGIGFNEWARPPWMTSSIDMFWIIDAIRHGLVAELSIMTAFFSMFLGMAMKKGLDERSSSYRAALLISLTGYFIAGWTVYFWNAAFVLFIFLIGCGAWIIDAPGSTVQANMRSADRRGKAGRRHA